MAGECRRREQRSRIVAPGLQREVVTMPTPIAVEDGPGAGTAVGTIRSDLLLVLVLKWRETVIAHALNARPVWPAARMELLLIAERSRQLCGCRECHPRATVIEFPAVRS